MSGLFRGALNLIQGESTSNPIHPLVGTQLEVGSIRLRVDSLIAEGGFAVVFAAYDSAHKWYALKRQLTKDREAMEAVMLEIRILKELSGHPSIIEFHGAAQLKIPSGGVEFLLLTELCPGGSVADLMKNSRISPKQALRIFYAAARAICHMHERKVPITHRDMKIENLLFDATGRVKLCDFGSATVQTFHPDDTWNITRRTQLEEEMQRHTTPMYRAPEILDTYQNYVVGPQQDIWALGCVLFYLCYHVHPFEDSAKLRILNVAYTIPSGSEECRDILPVIESCLKADPVRRPGAKDLVERTEALSVALNIDLSKPVINVDTPLLKRVPGRSSGAASNAAPPRPPPPRSAVAEEVTEQASAMLGALKGQGLSLLKNLREKSSAVVQKVQAKLAPQEVTWITSRLCIIPVARHAQEQVDEDEWNARVASTGRPYVVYNLSARTMHSNNRVEQMPCALRNIRPQVHPPIDDILKVCSAIVTSLRHRPGTCVVLYGAESHCVMVSAALLVYCKLVGDVNDAYDFVSNKRRLVQRFAPSQIHILDLIKNLTSAASVVLLPRSRPMSLRSISFSPLPLLAGVRSGVRPIIEIYVNSSKVWESEGCKRSLTIAKSLSSELDVGDVLLDGQVTLLMSYSRSDSSDATSKKFMFSVVFHTSTAEELMKFARSDIDISAVEENNIPPDFSITNSEGNPSRFGPLFSDSGVLLQCMLAGRHHGYQALGQKPHIFQRIALGLRIISDDSLSYDSSTQEPDVLRAGSPDLLVLDFEEQKQIMDWYSMSSEASASMEAGRSEISSDASQIPVTSSSDFFETLEWTERQQVNAARPPPPPPPVIHEKPHVTDPNLFSILQSERTQTTGVSSPSSRSNSSRLPMQSGADIAEAYERQAGIRVSHVADPDADQYRFDCEKETPILSAFTPPCAPVSEFDLLDLGSSGPSNTDATQARSPDPFSDLLKDSWSVPTAPAAPNTDDLLGDWTAPTLGAGNPSAIHRNVSAPAFQPTSATTIDPFAEFLSQSASNPTSTQASTSNSGCNTPKPARPNYSRTAFEGLNNTNTTGKAKVSSDTFGDLLSSQGFTTSSAKNMNRTLGDMKRAEEIKEMDPVSIKIRDWVNGKEKNIRALLGSLNDVLWEGAEKWQQPSMADLLTANQVKRSYYKACLVVHPDKQVGQEHEKLARAIFTELNEAWNAFEQSGSQLL
ncbi:unnamed protein product [Cylicocyclus nassatus]|uniref:Cyclin-G-associated kinase n=1 Tax=Cylicocyclus nassatus TaxID=53992 RepID=A0AA36HH28_CYLNA|nr:unnamed protein product [Cylicocyclus nassatus]